MFDFNSLKFPLPSYGGGFYGGLPNYVKLIILGYGGEVFSYNGELCSQYVLASFLGLPPFLFSGLCSV